MPLGIVFVAPNAVVGGAPKADVVEVGVPKTLAPVPLPKAEVVGARAPNRLPVVLDVEPKVGAAVVVPSSIK